MIAVHEAWIGPEVMLMTGKISKDTVDWEEEQRIDNGYRITAALNNTNKKVVIVIKNNRTGYGEGVLRYKFGTYL